jgi:predicted transcriptional regulator
MARISWFDKDTNLPVIDEQVERLESFTEAMKDGVIERQELEKQSESLMAILRDVEPILNDDQHEKVTRLLVELSAYNIMRLLHELHTQRLQKAFSK